jgi:hypothetical protein
VPLGVEIIAKGVSRTLMNTNDTIAFGIGTVFLLSVIPIIGGLMYARRERLLTHAERMKALELGEGLPDDATAARIKAAMGQSTEEETGSTGSLVGKCFSTAVWVAFWGFAAAAGLGGAAVSTGVAYAIAAAAGAIGVTAVICGTILALKAAPTAARATHHAKRHTDEADAFDVVSCRG